MPETNRPRDEWRAEIREANAAARSAGWRTAIWVVAVVAFLGLLAGGIWAIRVATSGPRGAGDVVRKTNDANNRIFAQQHFQDLYNQLLAYDQQLDQAAADKKQYPDDRTYAVNYSGLVKQCIDARNQYNADANKVTQAKWRDADLPYQIDATNPVSDCKEQK